MSSIETVPPVIDAEEARRERNRKLERTGRWLLPLLIMTAAVFSWDRICVWNEIPQYILPRPGVVLNTLIEDAGLLFASLLVTLRITMLSLALAVVGGVGLSVLFHTVSAYRDEPVPVCDRSPGHTDRGDLPADQHLCRRPDHETLALRLDRRLLPDPVQYHARTQFGRPQPDRLFQAQRRQPLADTLAPETAGCDAVFSRWLKIAGGLALIGAVVAEFVAGTAGQSSGLASRIIEAGYRLNAPRLFAALILISLTGIIIFLALSWISHLVLHRWHESALKQEQ
jgi:NitT/TauT family transport system permease protein